MDQIKKMSYVTYFDGKKFRSRAEAKVAYIFKKLGIEYDYEEEYYTFSDGTQYLPDFFLPKYDQWVEVKGYMTDTDKAKIKMLEDEVAGSQVVVIDEHLHFTYLDGTPLWLSLSEGFTTDFVIYADVVKAVQDAQAYNFQQDIDDLYTVVTDPYTRLCNLKKRYLQAPYYDLQGGEEPRIVNFCSDTRTVPYTYIGYDIVIFCIEDDIDLFKLMLTKNEGTEVIYEFVAGEERVKYACTQIFRMAFDLYNGAVEAAELRRVALEATLRKAI